MTELQVQGNVVSDLTCNLGRQSHIHTELIMWVCISNLTPYLQQFGSYLHLIVFLL